MPINLGQLPSDKPIPNGAVQICRGAADAGMNLDGAGILSRGPGWDALQINYRPTYDCFWIVRANVMLHGMAAAWYRSDWQFECGPADMDGAVRTQQIITENYLYSPVEWRTTHGSAVFRLRAGTSYSCYVAQAYTQGTPPQYHTGPNWLRLIGRVIGEGTL